MAKKIKRYDGEEGSYVRDDDDPESQKVYSSRGTGAGLSDDEEGGLYEVEYKPEPKVVSKPKAYEMQPEKEIKPKATIADAKTAIKHLTNTVNKAIPQKVAKKDVDNRPFEKVAKKDVDNRPFEKVAKKDVDNRPFEKVATKTFKPEPQAAQVSKVKDTPSSFNVKDNFLKTSFGFKSGGSVRGHGIESRGKTKGRFV